MAYTIAEGRRPEDLRSLLHALEELTTLVHELIDSAETRAADGDDVAPRSAPHEVCHEASVLTARMFDTTDEQLVGANRARPVTDARAVAMAASRASGLTLSAIASYFEKDHTSVRHAVLRVEQQPRLARAASWVAERIDGGDTMAALSNRGNAQRGRSPGTGLAAGRRHDQLSVGDNARHDRGVVRR